MPEQVLHVITNALSVSFDTYTLDRSQEPARKFPHVGNSMLSNLQLRVPFGAACGEQRGSLLFRLPFEPAKPHIPHSQVSLIASVTLAIEEMPSCIRAIHSDRANLPRRGPAFDALVFFDRDLAIEKFLAAVSKVGRDGLPGDFVLATRRQNVGVHPAHIGEREVTTAALRHVAFDVLDALATRVGKSPRRVSGIRLDTSCWLHDGNIRFRGSLLQAQLNLSIFLSWRTT